MQKEERDGASGTKLETEFETWEGARRALERAGFQPTPGIAGLEERYLRNFPDLGIEAEATLTRPVIFGEIHAVVRFLDSQTGELTEIENVWSTLTPSESRAERAISQELPQERGNRRFGRAAVFGLVGLVVVIAIAANSVYSDDDLAISAHGENHKTATSPSSTPQFADMNSRQILRLEIALQRLGYNPGIPDGKFDWRTREALEAWQRASGIGAADGMPTRSTLNQVLAVSNRSTPRN
jgi:hypothetical protein